MLTKEIKYKELDGTDAVWTANFHLSKLEMMDMQFSKKGGFEVFLKEMIETEDAPELWNMFKKIVLDSYGKKSEDGKSFVKNKELRDEFEQSEAFGELLLEIMQDTEGNMAAFIRGIMPAGFVPNDLSALPPPATK